MQLFSPFSDLNACYCEKRGNSYKVFNELFLYANNITEKNNRLSVTSLTRSRDYISSAGDRTSTITSQYSRRRRSTKGDRDDKTQTYLISLRTLSVELKPSMVAWSTQWSSNLPHIYRAPGDTSSNSNYNTRFNIP